MCEVVFLKENSLFSSNICSECFAQEFPVENFGKNSRFKSVDIKGQMATLVTFYMKNVLFFPLA